MKLYFLSSVPCALLINGVYFGVTDLFERTADVDLRDNLYAEFLPENAQPIGFFITEQLRTTPPNGCEIYLLEDGIAIYARDFAPTDLTLRILWQKRQGDCLATLYQQGRLYLSVQTPQNFFNAYLPPSFSAATPTFHQNFILLSTDGELIVFTQDGKMLLHERVCSFSLNGNALTARLPLSDRLRRYADCVWELSEDDCKQTAFTICEEALTGEQKQPPDGLLAYAFFESVLIGANFEDMLADELLADKDKIRAFLGDFVGVTLTSQPTRCGLIRRLGERLFSVDYFQISIKDGKIVEIVT